MKPTTTQDDDGEFEELKAFDMEVHNYKADPSFRCFHVNLTKPFKAAGDDLRDLCISVIASTGTQLVAYLGYGRQMCRGTCQTPTAWAWGR